MNRSTSEAFAKARAEGRAALVGYLPAGFPDVETSKAIIDTATGACKG